MLPSSFSCLHSPILEPYFDLCLLQFQHCRNFGPSTFVQIFVCVKFLFQLCQLMICEVCPIWHILQCRCCLCCRPFQQHRRVCHCSSSSSSSSSRPSHRFS